MSKSPTLYSLYKNESSESGILTVNQYDELMIVVNNFAPISHPLHFHGHDFYILATGKDSNSIQNFNQETDGMKLNFNNPPIRDTFKVPKFSWVVLGINMNNPGSWLFHCHITFDMEAIFYSLDCVS